MPTKRVSQRTLVCMMDVMEEMTNEGDSIFYETKQKIWSRLLYGNEFHEWFVRHADKEYRFDWDTILRELRSDRFFFFHNTYSLIAPNNILGKGHLSHDEAKKLGETMIQRVASLVTTQSGGESVRRSLELDGFQVNEKQLKLIPIEGPVSEQEEEDRFISLVRSATLPSETEILRHLQDAGNHYRDGNDHSLLSEARSLLQALLDDISDETDRNGGHSSGLPGGTKNRIEYLKKVSFLSTNEEAAFNSAWGMLSAGAHPGIPAKEEARIGLILALEFSQLLVLKFQNWKANGFRAFSP